MRMVFQSNPFKSPGAGDAPLHIIFEKSWEMNERKDDWKRANVVYLKTVQKNRKV